MPVPDGWVRMPGIEREIEVNMKRMPLCTFNRSITVVVVF